MLNEAKAVGLKITMFSDLMELGSDPSGAPDFDLPSGDDVYMLSYKSGTTGDTKGVKISHKQMLSNGYTPPEKAQLYPGDRVLSYMSMHHCYEQFILCLAILSRLQVGFYGGDPRKIVDDC